MEGDSCLVPKNELRGIIASSPCLLRGIVRVGARGSEGGGSKREGELTMVSVDQNYQDLVDRTDAKLRYARLHLDELRPYERLGSLDDWERAHTESVLFHLVGAKDAFLQEINYAYELGLRPSGVNENILAVKLHERGQHSEALRRITELRDDGKSWYSLMLALRNQGAHRNHINRLAEVGVGSARDMPRTSHFKDPRNNKVIDQGAVATLQKFYDSLELLLSELRPLLPRLPPD